MRIEKAYKLFQDLGAIITDSHIVYTSGRHGSTYINKDVVYAHPYETFQVCRALAEMFINDEIDAIIGPAVGGVILSQWVGFHLTAKSSKSIISLYADKNLDGDFILRRDYQELITNKKTLVVEDIINTGASVKRVVDLVKKNRGQVVGIGALCNRGISTAQSLGNVPKLQTLFDLKLDTWTAKECPLCREEKEINTKVGKGAEFIAWQNQ